MARPNRLFRVIGNGRSMVKKPTDDETLQQAAAREAASPDEAGALYADILRRDRGNLEASNALERLAHAESFGLWMRVDCTSHPQDDIFRFIRSAPETRDPIRAYLADGWRTLSELMVLLERVDRPLLNMYYVLEFADGFGRFTRHLAPLITGWPHIAAHLPGACVQAWL